MASAKEIESFLNKLQKQQININYTFPNGYILKWCSVNKKIYLIINHWNRDYRLYAIVNRLYEEEPDIDLALEELMLKGI